MSTKTLAETAELVFVAPALIALFVGMMVNLFVSGPEPHEIPDHLKGLLEATKTLTFRIHLWGASALFWVLTYLLLT